MSRHTSDPTHGTNAETTTMMPTATTMVAKMSAFLIVLIVALRYCFLLKERRKDVVTTTVKSRKEKERIAKQSFFVRRSDLRRTGICSSYQQKNKRRKGRLCSKGPSKNSVASDSSLSLSLLLEEGEDGTNGAVIVGLDCEMVGSGPNGSESMLARCSIVTFDRPSNDADAATSDGGKKRPVVVVVYDKYVRPTKTVTDYRTKWSAITPTVFDHKSCHYRGVEIVSHAQCRVQVMSLLSSFRGNNRVVVVGHALKNDFDALQLRHSRKLTRDTALYPPLMLSSSNRGTKMYSQKLSFLALEQLGLLIQNDTSGHCSVQDATAALMLYWKHSNEWERSLGYPLHIHHQKHLTNCSEQTVVTEYEPLTLYLDGCNLPMGLRRIPKTNADDDDPRQQTFSYQLISKNRSSHPHDDCVPFDWLPLFRTILSNSSTSKIEKVVILFDGAKYKQCLERNRPKKVEEISNGLFLEVTDLDVAVDDVVIQRCREGNESPITTTEEERRWTMTIDEVIEHLNSVPLGRMGDGFMSVDAITNYITVKRRGGGTKTNRVLFTKLNLRRPEEGVLCLTCLTPRSQNYSLQIAHELRRAKLHADSMEYEIREIKRVRSIVITDDVLLAHRVIQQTDGGSIVLNFKQFQHMF